MAGVSRRRLGQDRQVRDMQKEEKQDERNPQKKAEAGQTKRASFVQRLLSGVVLVILAVILVTSGGLPLFFATLAISLIGLFEMYRVFGIEKRSLGYVGYLTVAVYYGLVYFALEQYMTLMIVASLMLLLSFYVLTFPEYKVSVVAKAFMGVVYVGVMLSCLYQTRMMTDGRYLVWLIFLSSWGSDTCAYCAGMLFGKHKMAPILSPKKTVEGAVGGILGAALLGALFGTAFGGKLYEVENPAVVCACACAIGALISMLGDLAASAIKRDYGVKDYGHCIPGHGGIMDRFDSVIFTAPAVYFALSFLKYL